ncbi:hypothetical protein ACLI08_07665 [Flavobacterium sp. RNTU_13]|uniref:hypothetical protein n=1 Tax=Flavobacterium sp. RNTU_13 TaxID=3375145 RepID=UPI003987104C
MERPVNILSKNNSRLNSAAAIQRSNPLFDNSLRSMSAGDYINIHQKQHTRVTGRFNWLAPEED